MKKIVTISLFIFWAVVTAVLTAGLVFYQNQASQRLAINSPINNEQTNGQSQLILNLTEITKHNSINDCWLLINNKVYNVTSYLTSHPGGVGTISPYCGQEATRAFQTKDRGQSHSSGANSLLANYYIGDLNQTIGQQQIQQNVQQTNSVPPSNLGGENEFEDD